MPRMAAGSRPRRARRRSVSRRFSPQSTSRQVSSPWTTSALPPLPLASEAKRSNSLLQLLVQQREDALRGLGVVRAALLVEDVHLARRAGLDDLDAILLGGQRAVGAEDAREEARLVLVGLGIGIAHEVEALLAVAVFHREADAVEREADAPPDAIERLVHLEQLTRHAFLDARAVVAGDGGLHLFGRLLLLHAEAHHQPAHVLRFQLWIARPPLPLGGAAARRAGIAGLVHLFQAAVADVDLGALAVGGALEAGAELVALPGRVELVERPTDHVAQRAVGELRPALGPIRLHHADLRLLGLHQEAVLLPEILDHRPELLRRLVDHQPALAAGALDMHVVGGRRQDAARGRGGLRFLALGLVAGKRRRARARAAGVVRHHVAAIALRRAEVGRHLERRQRRGRLVFGLVLAFEPVGDPAATEQENARANQPAETHQPRPSTTRSPGRETPAPCSASRTVWWNLSASGESGRRRPGSMSPISPSAHLTGIGFDSTNSRWCSGSRR